MSRETISNQDEIRIRALFEQMLKGWNKGSGKLFAEPFEDEAVFIAFDGSQTKGRAHIERNHQELFDTWLQGSQLVGKITSIRFLSADVALVHSTGGTILKGKEKPSPERESIQTLVAVRKGDAWKFAAFHNNRVRPISNKATNAFIWMFTDWLWKPVV